jgi:hypothetical protein
MELISDIPSSKVQLMESLHQQTISRRVASDNRSTLHFTLPTLPTPTSRYINNLACHSAISHYAYAQRK